MCDNNRDNGNKCKGDCGGGCVGCAKTPSEQKKPPVDHIVIVIEGTEPCEGCPGCHIYDQE